jgi:glucose-6-phosphate isomerase
MANREIKTHLGPYYPIIQSALTELADHQIIERIWKKDHTVWKPKPTEITNRLGWLDIVEVIQGEVDRMTRLKARLLEEGYTNVLLLGMGGSSLAPEVFAKTFGSEATGLKLSILDSTDPDAVLTQAKQLDLTKTLFIVATKSGGTVETLSFFKFFYNKILDEIGEDQAGDHFIAITDPGSKLERLANELNFREIFLNNPNIGGRFSVMSFFGLVPASLVGVDILALIERTNSMIQACGADVPVENNPGALLGAVMGALHNIGRDKVTLIASPEIASFGDWVEQLIAESTGKDGKGILPVVGENLGTPAVYANDRIFINLCLGDDNENDPALEDLANAGHPVIHLQLTDKFDLGGQFFLWESATAVSGYFLQINPFDQPNVESAKVLARKMVNEYENTGKLPEAAYEQLSGDTLVEFLATPSPGSYICIQAYIAPSASADKILSDIRMKLRDKYKVATTMGYGPRFLHSTGQLHKGDSGRGLFIQITSETDNEILIPDQPGSNSSSMSFQTLKLSQALGDAAALEEAGRRLIRFQINQIQELNQLT